MKKIKAVIGANYGDEGKGLMSRYFCLESLKNNERPIVILHNGTSQRGHTVDLLNGERYVMHHFGSGTIDGVPTFYTAPFYINPLMFYDEYKLLESKGITPEVYIDDSCGIVTPIDMIIDQMYAAYVAEKEGRSTNGSCACGSWSASDRTLATNLGFHYKFWDFIEGDVVELCNRIIHWIPFVRWSRKMKEYPKGWEKWESQEEWDKLFDYFLMTFNFMTDRCHLVSLDEAYSYYDTLIFEGAQGLLLDKNNKEAQGWTTSSHTGLRNVILLTKDYDCPKEACYVTRSYITKHGGGPFPELNSDIFFSDETNQPNQYQGTLKFGNLNESELMRRISEDGGEDSKGFKKTIAVTHLNEMPTCLNMNYASSSKYAEEIIRGV